MLVLSLDNINSLIILNKSSLLKCEDKEYEVILKWKIQLLINEKTKRQLDLIKEAQRELSFVGLFTYDIRVFIYCEI